MTNKDITKIYFRGNEIVALYKGDTLIFKKSGGGSTGVYTVRGTVNPFSGEQSIQLCVNGKQEQFNVNSDNTFEHTFVNVPITNMGYFTQPCRDKLKTLDLSEFDTSQVTSMYEAFYQCSNLTSIDLTNVNTSKVTDMTLIFYGCKRLTSLDVSNFDTSKVTSMDAMFNGCSNLTSLDVSNFDTSNVTLFERMFYGCNNLTSLDISNFDTSKLIGLSDMFGGCNRLSDLYLNFNISNITYSLGSFPYTFSYCFSLKNVVGKFEGTKFDLYLSDCPLTAQSAMVFINGLATVTEKRRLSLSATTYDSLTPEQIAIATSKGWTVTRG